jgi:hypothetical protein
MPQLTLDVLEEAVSLIGKLRSGSLGDDEISDVVMRLNQLLPDPLWFDFSIDHEPELPAEEAVRRAFEYRPIILGGPAASEGS